MTDRNRKWKRVEDPDLTSNSLVALKAMLNGDVLVKSTGLKYVLELKRNRITGKEMKRFTKRSYLKGF